MRRKGSRELQRDGSGNRRRKVNNFSTLRDNVIGKRSPDSVVAFKCYISNHNKKIHNRIQFTEQNTNRKLIESNLT